MFGVKKQRHYRATFEINRLEAFQKILLVGISEATYHSCNDDRDCEWCNANNGVKLLVSEDLNNEVNQNCTCDWCKGFFTPEINLEK